MKIILLAKIELPDYRTTYVELNNNYSDDLDNVIFFTMEDHNGIIKRDVFKFDTFKELKVATIAVKEIYKEGLSNYEKAVTNFFKKQKQKKN